MSDLEITKLCAEAMGYTLQQFSKGFRCRDKDGYVVAIIGLSSVSTQYDPLHDDAQAMALVKRFLLSVEFYEHLYGDNSWHVSHWKDGIHRVELDGISQDLNRAICECVAKMQQAK